MGEGKIHETGAGVGRARCQDLFYPGGGGLVAGEEEEITAATGAEELGGGEMISDAVKYSLHLGRVGAGVQTLV